MITPSFSFHFQLGRFLIYFRYLALFYLRKMATPFLYTSIGYIFYIFVRGGLDWSLPSYSMIHIAVNLFFFITLVNISVKIFSPLHQPHSSLQELGIPISIEERFLGNFLFYGVGMLGLVYVIHACGYGLMAILEPEGRSEFDPFLRGDYTGITLVNFLQVYIFFFAGSIYFRKSPIAKSLLCLVLALTISTLIFSIPIFSFGLQLQEESFSFGGDRNNSGGFLSDPDNLGKIREITHYLFYSIWFLGSYFKLRRSQFRV